ncbi:peptidase inhibitor family I36 protein [Streptomyces smyrnaeus]|uniref:Peptidase inhibitor family I36 protein n=1 Tax=Streptomyces smyrnaeus TaxID=1387713 RepID=A0ABS3XSS5_9ACTN|nr:peptidase inhibitor family I36 protein [Streptomyces smyrnaeus]MBO8198399.1 peptidase inhibitor family I36 protein [Streptomyces smyrnaeus]
MIKKAMMLAAAGLLTVATAGVATAVDGSQLTGKDACPRSYVCVWDNTSFSGKPKWKSQGNLYDLKSYNGISIFNNGVRYPGGDHIRYQYTYRHSTSPHYKGCLHYPGDSPTTAKSIGVTVILDYAKWGGEC